MNAFCTTCATDVETYHDETAGYLVCTSCGHIIEQVSWSSDPQFTKEGGEATVAGHFVSNNAGSHGLGRISGGRIYGLQYDSTEKASSRGRVEIERLVEQLSIRPRDDVCNAAHRVYLLAIQHNFTRGRRTNQIAAAAIYIVCRQENHPFMLLDFSDVLQVNVFVLGSVFLQLGKLMRLEEHPIMTRPVDPSLYLHRFADKLGFGKKMQVVANTALRLVSSMKRDWLQTGRRPAGICGAALFIAGHIHGFSVTKEDVVRVVHIGVSTLDKRVNEVASTGASDFTVVEFEEHSRQLEAAEQQEIQHLERQAALLPAPATKANNCAHIGQGAPYFASGMCKDCYLHFLQVTGGMATGANPPAFQAAQARQSHLAIEGEEEDDEEQLALDGEVQLALPQFPGQGANDVAAAIEDALNADEAVPEPPTTQPLEEAGPSGEGTAKKRGAELASSPAAKRRRRQRQNRTPEEEEREASEAEPTEAETRAARGSSERAGSVYETPQLEHKETLSDVSDEEAEMFLHSEEEVKLKAIVWTAMNQDYIDKQALKAACQTPKEDSEPGQAENTGKRARGRPKGSKSRPKPEDNLEPSETAVDGIRKVLTAKKLSSKINYDNLDSLFDSSMPPPPSRSATKAAKAPPLSPRPRSSDGGVAAAVSPRRKDEIASEQPSKPSQPKSAPSSSKSVGTARTAPKSSGEPAAGKPPRSRASLGTMRLSSLKSGLPKPSDPWK